MATPASKRRKLEHATSDEGREEDLESFQSSSASADEDVEQEDADSDDDFDEESAGQDSGNEGEGNAALDGQSSRYGSVSAPNTKSAGPKPDAVNRSATSQADSRRNTYTSSTFKSNMFKLQVDELLEQIRPRHGRRETEAEDALHKLKKTIESIPPKEALTIDDAERQLLMSSKVAVPFPNPRPPKDAKYKLEYAKPANINVVGSHPLKISNRARKTTEIDMVVMMPSKLLQEKDFLNFRYFYKRAYFLACIAAGLKETHGKDFEIKFQHFQDNPLKTILAILPLAKSSKSTDQSAISRWQINVMPCVPEDVFPQNKLRPDKNCVRHQGENTAKDAASEGTNSATPFYNSSLRSDMLVTSYLRLLHTTSKSCESFRDAGLLGTSWLRQRGIGREAQSGGFGTFEWGTLMALLLQSGGPGGRPMLSESYSSYQLMKATLQLLAVKDLRKQPLIIGADTSGSKFGDGSAPVVWDGLRDHNLLYKMTPWSYKLLRQEARTTLSMLGDERFDGFEAAFILRADNSLYRYDCVMELDAPSVDGTTSGQDHLILEGYRKLYDTLQKGLGDRASQINIIPPSSQPRALGSSKRTMEKKLLVGFMINPETVGRTIDHGPTAEEKSKSASFRKFWGEKAELRRFKDGSILESLVWSGKEGDPSVLEQIVRYLVERHFGGKAGQSVRITEDGSKRMLQQGSGFAAFNPFMDAYKQLEIDIRGLDGLPLSIRQISPADAQLRCSSKTPPLHIRPSKPAGVVLQFEGSARWPDDLIAIQRTKIAFLLKLQELLQDSIDGVTARIGLENENHDILNQAFLDIVYDTGAAFRIRIHHDREQTLLERKLQDKTLDPSSKELAAQGLAKYKRDYLKAPSHTQAIARLCSHHPAMSGTIRLMKKWFASHLLSHHIADEVIELFVARTFVQPWPWQIPSVVQTGFFRTLSWLARWDWRAEPLIVDLSGSNELKQAEMQSITTKFDAWRKLDPALNRVVMFTASNVDTDGTTWTDGRPAKVIAGRMTALARAASAEIEEKQLSLDIASLFVSPLSEFDFVIHIDPELVGRKSKRKHSGKNGVAFKNLELDLAHDGSLVGLDPLQDFTNDIERLYGSAILFFSGDRERPVIAGLWNPQTSPRAWKLNLSYSTTPVKRTDKDDVEARINKEGILAEIAHLGGDMIQRIEVNGQ